MKDTQVRDGNKQIIDLNLGDPFTEIIEAHSSYTLHQQLTILAWYLENTDRTVFHNTPVTFQVFPDHLGIVTLKTSENITGMRSATRRLHFPGS